MIYKDIVGYIGIWMSFVDSLTSYPNTLTLSHHILTCHIISHDILGSKILDILFRDFL